MKKSGKKAFSIILAMILVAIMLLVAYNLLDLIIPFAKNTKGIENSSAAYYNAYGRLEESIHFIVKNPVGSSTGKTMPNTATGYSISMISTGTKIPPDGKGNSEYDKDWNRIGPGEPIQIYLGNNVIDWDRTKFYFRVPDLNLDGSGNETLSGGDLGIINWQISGSGNTLNASGSQIRASQIGNIRTNWADGNINISSYDGLDLNGSGKTLSSFYNSIKSSCDSEKCSLKLSIINKLKTTAGASIPYLEYQIDFQTPVPQQYVDITTEGKSYGFKKTINTKYKVDTTSEAFDFTVFQ